MNERLPQAENPFSAVIIIVMISVGTIAFVALFALLAWSPDLANKNRAGDHPYSESALGYSGLVTLLEADGQSVSVSRLSSTLTFNDGLLIITIPRYGTARAGDIELQSVTQPALYVLPKWAGYRDRANPSWQRDTELLNKRFPEQIARDFDSDISVWRLRNPGRIETPFGRHTPRFEHKMQVIETDSLEPIVQTAGGTLLAKLPGREIYLLSDPDLINTFGLARRDNARMALGLIEWIKDFPEQSITLDATLHGFERSESLLRAIFDVPFLGATMIAIATILLVGWAAFIRFAPPLRDPPVRAFGKIALAESSAGLISMTRREGQMAPAYLTVVRRNLARRIGLPEQTSDEAFAQSADRLAKRKALDRNWSDHRRALQAPTTNRNELRDKALNLWRWREEMKDGH
ncbi:MAG: DUF4350 domain-containing protein [Pseudomonadota bacterium]